MIYYGRRQYTLMPLTLRALIVGSDRKALFSYRDTSKTNAVGGARVRLS